MNNISIYWKKNNFILLLILLFFLTSNQFLQRIQDIRFPRLTFAEDFKYLPSSPFLKGASLSFDEVLADLLWIKSIGYFGDRFQDDKNYQWLYRLLDVTTNLDPYFQDPYEFGGITLGYVVNDFEHSNKLLKKGMVNVPKRHERYWYLPFFTAFNYMYFKGDYQTAAHYLEIASSFPQRPDYLPLLVARLYANTEDPGMAIPFLQKMIERAATPEMKEKIQQRIKEIKVKQHILLLTEAKNRYRQRFGSDPRTLENLIDQHLIKEIPPEPFGGTYFISSEDGRIWTTSKLDDMKLHIYNNSTLPIILPKKP